MIEIRGLQKSFGALRVLDRLDLSIQSGRITALIGPNGAGKTTLIRSILGLTHPDGGRIMVDGELVNGDCSYRARIGYMPQIARFPENLTGAELIAMLEDLRGAPASQHNDLLARFELEDHLQKPLRTLSGGTRQRINAVLAFLFRPDILILDEPTAGLDPVASGVFKAMVLAEREAGRTIIVTSHVMAELEEFADDVVFLLDGRVRFHGSLLELEHLTRQTNLERAVAELMHRTQRPEVAA
jgi:Cu-processing system ATP-binding protein